jgi:peptide/nickel transport system substrate-binding protein
MKQFSKLAALGLTVAGLAYAGPADNSLVVGTSQEPRVLAGDVLSIISSQAIKGEMENWLFAPLLQLNADSQIEAGLATEVPTPANRRIRFSDAGQGKRKLEVDLTLKNGLKWSDGDALDTDDVSLLFEMGKTPNIGVPNPDFWDRVSFKAKDKQNFTITFEPAYYYDAQLSLVGGFHVPAHKMKAEWDKAQAAAAKLDAQKDVEKIAELYRNYFQTFSTPQAVNSGKMAYSGAFRASRWVPGSSVDMVRNPNSVLVPAGGADKYVQKVTYRFIQNTNSLLVAILGGGIDATSTVGLTLDQARSKQLTTRAPGRFDIWSIPGAVWEHIDVNKFSNVGFVKELGLDDKRTRQALLHSLNRDAWVKAFFDGLEPVSNTFITPSNPLFNPNVKKYEYSPEKANALFADLGWKKGADGILTRTVGGKTVRFELEWGTTAGNVTRERTQQFFAEQLKQVGVAVKIANAPSSVIFSDENLQHGEDGKWQFLMFAWISSLAEDGNLFIGKNQNTGAVGIPTKDNGFAGNNVGNWKNDEFDKLVSQAVVEFDEAKRKALFARAQEIWADELPALPLRFRANPIVTRVGLNNLVISTYSGGLGYIGWNAHEVGWASKGAQKLYDQTKYGLPVK